jgi:hypothetical protein
VVILGRMPAIGFGRDLPQRPPFVGETIDASPARFEPRDRRRWVGRDLIEEGGDGIGFGRAVVGKGSLEPLGESPGLQRDTTSHPPGRRRELLDQTAAVVGRGTPFLDEPGVRGGILDGILVGQDDDPGPESVNHPIKPRPILALGRVGSGRFKSGPTIGFD